MASRNEVLVYLGNCMESAYDAWWSVGEDGIRGREWCRALRRKRVTALRFYNYRNAWRYLIDNEDGPDILALEGATEQLDRIHKRVEFFMARDAADRLAWRSWMDADFLPPDDEDAGDDERYCPDED